MGGKSSSSSSQSTKASTQNINAQGNTAPIVIPEIKVNGKNSKGSIDSDVIIDLSPTDYGVIEAAGSIVNKSIELSQTALARYEQINAKSLDELSGAVKLVDEANESEDQQNFTTLTKWVVIGAGVLIIAKVYSK